MLTSISINTLNTVRKTLSYYSCTSLPSLIHKSCITWKYITKDIFTVTFCFDHFLNVGLILFNFFCSLQVFPIIRKWFYLKNLKSTAGKNILKDMNKKKTYLDRISFTKLKVLDGGGLKKIDYDKQFTSGRCQ